MSANEILIISIVMMLLINFFIVYLTLTSDFSKNRAGKSFYKETFEEMQKGTIYKW